MNTIIVHYEVSRFCFTLSKIPENLHVVDFPHKSNEHQNFILESKADERHRACAFK